VTDYNYDNQRVNVDSKNRDDNNATDVDQTTYNIHVTPQGNWPGLDAKPRHVKFDADAMNQVAQWLEDRANELSDLPNSLNTNLSGVQFGPQNWPAARRMGKANEQVKGAVAKYTTELVTNLKQSAASIRAAAKAYKDSDDNSATSSNNQSAQL
jgi:hypothetical protein